MILQNEPKLKAKPHRTSNLPEAHKPISPNPLIPAKRREEIAGKHSRPHDAKSPTRKNGKKTKRGKRTEPPERTPSNTGNANGSDSPVLPPQFGPKPVLITALTKQHGAWLHGAVSEAIGFFRSALEARHIRWTRDGDPVDLGPDYGTRISTLKALLDFLTRGRQLVTPQTGPSSILYEVIHRVVTERLRQEHYGIVPVGPQPSDPPAPKIPFQYAPGDSVAISDLADAHGEELEDLLALGLASLEGVFQARKQTLDYDGNPVDRGPDRSLGRAAFALLLDLSTRGCKPLPPVKVIEKDPTFDAGVSFLAL